MLLRRPAALLLVSIALLAGCGDAGPSASAPASAAAPVAAPPATARTSPVPSASPSSSSADDVAWVVYQSSGDGLRLIHPVSGTSRRVLPDGPAGALHPDWSPDGARLVFAVDDADGTRDLWTSDWDGSNAAGARRLSRAMPGRRQPGVVAGRDADRVPPDRQRGRPQPGLDGPGRRHRHRCHHDPRVHDGCGVRGEPEVVAGRRLPRGADRPLHRRRQRHRGDHRIGDRRRGPRRRDAPRSASSGSWRPSPRTRTGTPRTTSSCSRRARAGRSIPPTLPRTCSRSVQTAPG